MKLNYSELLKIKRHKHLSGKVMLEGKSYKVSKKNTIFNMRFNRSNRTILTLQNTQLLNKGGQKKLYILNQSLSKTSIKSVVCRIREINTYTLRGL